jgi:hypothetical protein
VPATHADALEVLRTQVPHRLFRFAEHLAADPEMDLARAAAAVGAPGKGVELMKDARTARVLCAIIGNDTEALKDQRRQTLLMLATMISFDPALAFDQFNKPLPIHEIPPEVRACIKAYETKPDGSTKITFSSRLEAIKLMLAHFGDIENRTLAVGGHATIVFRGRGPIE